MSTLKLKIVEFLSPISDDHDRLWGILSLEELGFRPKTLPAAPKWVGGEVEALE